MTMTTLGTTPERLRGRWLGLAALTISGLVLGLDITILVTALPTLSAKLNATTDQLQWMSAAYTLALAGFMLPAGVLGDRLGRKRLLLIGLVTFGISSGIASQMTSANGLILMRVIMGASGAIVLPLMQSMLPSMFQADERQRAIGLAGAGSFIGLPLGPLLAGWLLTHYDWGSIFLINAPVVVIAVIGVWFFVPESKDPAARRLDWIGAVLEVLGVTGIVYGIIEQPVRGWTDVQVYVPIAGGAVLVAAFVMWQLRTRFPLIDLKLFTSRRVSWATVAFTIVGFAMTGVLFILSPFLQIVQGNDAQGTGRTTDSSDRGHDGRGHQHRLAREAFRRQGVGRGRHAWQRSGNDHSVARRRRHGLRTRRACACGERDQHRLHHGARSRCHPRLPPRRRDRRRERADPNAAEHRVIVRRRDHGH